MSYQGPLGGGGGGGVQSVTAGTNITIGGTPSDPVVTNNGVRSITAGTNVTIGGTSNEPVVNATGGVSGFTGSQNTSSPNNTVHASRLLVNAASTNADFVAEPKGTGAFQLQLADGTIAGGNKRGSASIDLQVTRTAATQVASGINAYALGRENVSSGVSSITLGSGNSATADYACAIGLTNIVTNQHSYVFGRSNTTSANQVYIIGKDNNVSSGGSLTFVFGDTIAANGQGNYVCFIGQNITASSSNCRNLVFGQRLQWVNFKHGVLNFGSNLSGRESTFKNSVYHATLTTTNASAQALVFNGQCDNGTNLVLQDHSTMTFVAYVSGQVVGGGNVSGYKLEGVVKRAAGAGTVALVGTPVLTVLAEEDSSWHVNASTSSGGLLIVVTGVASTSIYWSAVIHTVEIKG